MTFSARKNGLTREQTQTKPEGKSLTKQSEAESTDINVIMSKYIHTADPSVLQQRFGTFADVSNIGSFQECQNTIRGAQEAFNDLPAHIRDFFKNDPNNLVLAMENPDSRPDLERLGLLEPSAASSGAGTPEGSSTGTAEAATATSAPKTPSSTTAPSGA